MNLLAGFSTGLSVGIYCLGVCLPVFIPLILAERKNLKGSFLVTLEFSLGRLLGYLLFGTIVGYLGVAIQSQLVHQIINMATFLSGGLLVGYSLGLLKWGKACKPYFKFFHFPFLFGFLTGLNVCPPFLASLSYIFNLKSIVNSVFYFLMFFLGTSVYIIPLGFLGFFSKEGKLQKIARLSGLFAGLYFIYTALQGLHP